MSRKRPPDRSGQHAAGRSLRMGVSRGCYRVWIARIEDWEPHSWADLPPQASAIKPAEKRTLSARQAAHYVRAFNQVVLRGRPKVWAIAVPVATRYDGDLTPGQRIVSPPGAVPGGRALCSRRMLG